MIRYDTIRRYTEQTKMGLAVFRSRLRLVLSLSSYKPILHAKSIHGNNQRNAILDTPMLYVFNSHELQPNQKLSGHEQFVLCMIPPSSRLLWRGRKGSEYVVAQYFGHGEVPWLVDARVHPPSRVTFLLIRKISARHGRGLRHQVFT